MEDGDAQAWRHVEALRSLQPKVSSRGAHAIAAALLRLHSTYARRHPPGRCERARQSVRAATGAVFRKCLLRARESRVAAWMSGFLACMTDRYERVDEWVVHKRSAHPCAARWAIDVPIGAVSAAFFYADVASDVIIASELVGSRQTTWAALSIAFILLPCLLAYASMVSFVWRLRGATPLLCAVFALGLPWGVVLLDLVMFIELSSLLSELSDALPGVRALKLFLPSYRATRILWELSLETIPQSVLQLYIYMSLRQQPDQLDFTDPRVGNATNHNVRNVTPSEGHPVSRVGVDDSFIPLITVSLTFSLLNLIKCSVSLYLEAKRAGVGIRAHVWQQIELGRGLPLDALKSNSIDSWKCKVALNLSATRELCAAVRSNRSLRLLDCSFTELGPAGGIAMASMLMTNRSLTSLNLSSNQFGGGSTEWASAIAESLRVNSSLHSLNLSCNNIGPRSCAVLVSGLAANVGLYSLDLSKNCLVGVNALGHGEVNYVGVKALAHALECNSTLRRLALHDNQLGKKWTQLLLDLLPFDGATRDCSLSLEDTHNEQSLRQHYEESSECAGRHDQHTELHTKHLSSKSDVAETAIPDDQRSGRPFEQGEENHAMSCSSKPPRLASRADLSPFGTGRAPSCKYAERLTSHENQTDESALVGTPQRSRRSPKRDLKFSPTCRTGPAYLAVGNLEIDSHDATEDAQHDLHV
ncbi:MAG: hypothetical protein SGPRY_002219 [Prymnesium sp.]